MDRPNQDQSEARRPWIVRESICSNNFSKILRKNDCKQFIAVVKLNSLFYLNRVLSRRRTVLKRTACFGATFFFVVLFACDVQGQLFRRLRCNPCRPAVCNPCRQVACSPCSNQTLSPCQNTCQQQLQTCAGQCRMFATGSEEYMRCWMACDMQYQACVSQCGGNCGPDFPFDKPVNHSDPICRSAYDACMRAGNNAGVCWNFGTPERATYCECVYDRCMHPTAPLKSCNCSPAIVE